MSKTLSGETKDFLNLVLPACAAGKRAEVEAYLADPRGFAHWIGPHGRTMLWSAARSGRTQIVRLLAEAHDADPRAIGCFFRETRVEVSPWLAAHLRKHDETAAYLEDLGAGRDFMAACFLGDEALVRETLADDPAAAGRPVEREHRWNPYKAWPLQYAIAGHQPVIARRLLEAGADSKADPIILSDAAKTKFYEVAALLVAQGADPVATGKRVWLTDPKLLALAKACGHDLSEADFPPEIWPKLVDECRGNHNAPDDPSRILGLLEQGSDVNVRDYKNKTALHRAAQAGFLEIPKLLLEHDADLEARDESGETPLFDAAFHGRCATLRLLAEAGADLGAANHKGETAVFAAVRGGQAEALALLAELGCDLSAPDARGKTPRDLATRSRKRGIEAVRPLLGV